MTNKLTILTTIVITAATTAGGTYYLAINSQPGNTPANNPVATIETQQNDGNPVQVSANQLHNEPITIVVKTQDGREKLTERELERRIGHIRDLKQPKLSVMPGP